LSPQLKKGPFEAWEDQIIMTRQSEIKSLVDSLGGQHPQSKIDGTRHYGQWTTPSKRSQQSIITSSNSEEMTCFLFFVLILAVKRRNGEREVQAKKKTDDRNPASSCGSN
jgi:hypothetical protein